MEYLQKVKEFMQGKKPLALIYTYGCQQNENDSEKIKGMLYDMGYGFTDAPQKADFILFNTCAIRENAEKKVYGAIGAVKRLKDANPDLVIAVSGCMTGEEHNIRRLKSTYRQVDIVLGANNLQKLPRLLFEVLTQKKRVVCTEYTEDEVEGGFSPVRDSNIKAGVPIMYGCNNFCTYCIVPYVRGRERSRNEQDILNEVKALKDAGYKEIMLLGQNVNSYKGGGDEFARLLEKVSDLGVERIRFMTSHPKDLSDRVLDIMGERSNICSLLHLPVQSGSDAVLKSMNRHYDIKHYLGIIEKAKAKIKNLTLTTDIIVGFPTETENDFKETLSLLEEVRYDTIYSFIFSKRKGTPAYDMESVLSEKQIKENFNELIKVQDKISLEKNLALCGKEVSVLVEGKSKTNDEVFAGRTEGGKIVNFPSEDDFTGEIINIKIKEAKTWNLVGERI